MSGGTVSVVLCGLGGYGETYLRPLLDPANAARARLAAGVDPMPERSSLLPELRARGIPVHASLEDFYRSSTAELAVLCSPIHLHAPQSVLTLSRGSHLL